MIDSESVHLGCFDPNWIRGLYTEGHIKASGVRQYLSVYDLSYRRKKVKQIRYPDKTY